MRTMDLELKDELKSLRTSDKGLKWPKGVFPVDNYLYYKIVYCNDTMETLQIRIDDEIIADLQELMHLLKMSKSEAARNALAEGIKNLKMEIATRKYLNGEFTLGRAAEFSRTSIQEMAEYLAKHGVAYFRYDPSELAKDAETAKRILKGRRRSRK